MSYLKILRDSGDDTRRTSARDSLERALDLDTLMRLRDIASERWKDSDRMKKEEEEEEKEEEKEEEEEGGMRYVSHILGDTTFSNDSVSRAL